MISSAASGGCKTALAWPQPWPARASSSEEENEEENEEEWGEEQETEEEEEEEDGEEEEEEEQEEQEEQETEEEEDGEEEEEEEEEEQEEQEEEDSSAQSALCLLSCAPGAGSIGMGAKLSRASVGVSARRAEDRIASFSFSRSCCAHSCSWRAASSAGCIGRCIREKQGKKK
jgi:hypothetical protein